MIEITTNTAAFDDALQQLQQRLGNLRKPMQDIGAALETAVGNRRETGTDPNGRRWAAWSAGYAATYDIKRKGETGAPRGRVLERTGDMWEGLVSNASDDSVRVGSATPPTETTTVTPEEAAALQAQNEALAADLAAARSTLQAQASAANTAAHTAFAEALVAEARIAPADKALLVATLDHLEPAVLPGAQAQGVVEFGEGDAKKPMAEALKDWLKGLPKRVEFGEQAGRDRAALDTLPQPEGVSYAEGTPAETIELDKRIRAYATEHKLGYGEAALAVAMRR